MMNPQYLPPGQNNNAPANPLGYPPSSQEFNGLPNANYSSIPSNGPATMKPIDQDMSQKMQNINLNGAQGFPSVPTSQIPPGQAPSGAYPPHFTPGQVPPGQRPGPGPMPARPPVSGAQFPSSMGPPSSTPGPVPTQSFSQSPQTPQNQYMSGPPMQGPPSTQPGQMHSQSHPQGPKPSVSQMGPTQPGMAPQNGQGLPPQPGQEMPQPSQPPQSQAGQQMPRPGLSLSSQGSMPGQPQIRSTPAQPGFPPQPGQAPGSFPGQPSLPPQSGMPQGRPGPQSGQLGQPVLPPQTSQQGLPPQPTQQSLPLKTTMPPPQPGMPPQPQQGPPQPNFPPQPNQQFSQPGLPPQPGQGLPPQPGHQFGPPGVPSQLAQSLPPQPSIPPQQGQFGRPGIPSQPSQPGLPPQPGQFGSPGQVHPGQQTGQMPGLPFMPPPLSQQRQMPAQPGPPGPPGPGGPPGAPAGYPGMPPMPQQQQGFQQPPQAGFQQPPQPGFQQPPQPGFQQPPQPGFQQPPQPGFQQPPSGYPPHYQQQAPFPGQQPSYPNQQYQQPQKRLDPDQMPSPIQVMADDQQNRSGVFVTNDKGLVPPLVTTDFVVDDKGNASPRYIRSSMYTIPVTADLLKQTAMPFCLVVSPMAETVGPEMPPPLLDFAALTGSPTMGPVRCSRCKAYMCPSMKFVDAGRHFTCPFCKATTEVPMEYTQYINSMQQYGRVPAELALGAYEIVATKEYCRNNTLPNPPAMVFVIDVSYNSVKCGLLDTLSQHIMDIVAALPTDEAGNAWTRVGFITYSSTVHFYNIKGSLAQPQMMSVGDVSDMFVPLLEGFLVSAAESGAVLDALLQQLPAMFHDNRETETVLLPAVQAGLEALKAADTSGQLLVFHTSLPTYNAPGKLINREDRKLLGTDKEKTILAPANTAYNELGQSCAAAGVSVELFVCNNSYIDAATIGQLPRLTGGQIRKYTYFTAEVDGPRLVADARRVAARPTAHDAVMRLRTSTGVRPTDFYGHMFMSNTTDVELAAIDADKAIGIEIKHDDKLTAEEGVFVQAALLYTHRSGQRRLRVLSLALAVAHQLADVYRSMELDTTINFLTKQAVWALREAAPRAVREGLSSRCARSLAAYRRHCASPSSAGQLVLPESMKLLPLYTSCLLRSDAIAGGPDLSCDDRSCAMYRALTADVGTSLVYTYPRLLPLHQGAAPRQLRASVDKMADQGVYLLENGVHILIWVGSQAPAQFISDVFGVPSAQQIDTQVTELPVLDNEASEAVRAIVRDAREKRHSAMRLTVMRQHDKLETVLRHFLVEDRGADGSSSYVDYLCHVHKVIRTLL